MARNKEREQPSLKSVYVITVVVLGVLALLVWLMLIPLIQ